MPLPSAAKMNAASFVRSSDCCKFYIAENAVGVRDMPAAFYGFVRNVVLRGLKMGFLRAFQKNPQKIRVIVTKLT